MKKLLSIALAIMVVLSLAACGNREPLGCEGKYICAATTALGITSVGDDAMDLNLLLEVGGKGSCEWNGESDKLKWKLNGSQMSLTIDGTEFVGTYEKDVIRVNIMGLDCVFAIEGSDAAKPSNFMSAEEKQCVQDWFSYRVTNVLGDPLPAEEVLPSDLRVTLRDDYTASVSFCEMQLSGGGAWSVYSGFGSFDEDWTVNGEEASITFEMNENGEHLDVTFSCGDMYYIFTCAGEDEAKQLLEEQQSDVDMDTLLFVATSCTKDGTDYETDGDYIELYAPVDDECLGVVSFNGVLYDMEYAWYDDDTFFFTDEEGDMFEGVYQDGALIGTYFGYEYIFELVD